MHTGIDVHIEEDILT